MRLMLIAALLLEISHAAAAEQKVAVFIDATVDGNHPSAETLVFEMKDAMRGSNSFRLVSNFKQWPYIKVVVVTVPSTVGERERHIGIAYSYTIVYDSPDIPGDGALLTAGVSICPLDLDSLRKCARRILPHIEFAVNKLERDQPKLRKTLQ